jgi:Holliday junction resolvasome RuvABC endonuclease subunit
MSEQTRASRVSERLVQISNELRQLSEASEPESQKYLSIEETFTRVNALYTNTIDVELIAMQSGLHTNTVRKLFKDKDAFFNAKLSTIESFLDTLGMSVWTS